jgi:hypothetical protein
LVYGLRFAWHLLPLIASSPSATASGLQHGSLFLAKRLPQAACRLVWRFLPKGYRKRPADREQARATASGLPRAEQSEQSSVRSSAPLAQWKRLRERGQPGSVERRSHSQRSGSLALSRALAGSGEAQPLTAAAASDTERGGAEGASKHSGEQAPFPHGTLPLVSNSHKAAARGAAPEFAVDDRQLVRSTKPARAVSCGAPAGVRIKPLGFPGTLARRFCLPTRRRSSGIGPPCGPSPRLEPRA